MLIDGEKWACEACIRGHRVSSCQHSDRPLSHINRKGRPMSQCPHCRGLRKARANHVKCECGTKPHSKNDCPKKASGTNTQNNAATRKQCCCSHGTRCTCAAKKDSTLATVSETPSPGVSKRLPPTSRSPQPGVFRSELTGLAQRHKPRKERQGGHPYSIPRSHTVQSSAGLRHSVERLPVPDGGASPAYSYQEAGTSTPPLVQRRAVSEHGSPVPDFGDVGPHVPAIDIPYPPMGAASLSPSPLEYHPRSLGSSYGSDVDGLWDSGSMGLSPAVDWSTFDLAYGSDAMTNSVSHAGSFASFDYSNHYDPVTRSSSGVTSEPGDLSPVAGMHLHHEFPDKGSYPLTTSAPSLDVSRPQMVASPAVLGPMEPYPQDTEAKVPPPSLPTPSLVISQEPESYYTPVPLSVPQQPSYAATVDVHVGGVPATTSSSSSRRSTDQLLVTHGPMTTTGVSEPAWLPTSYPTTTAGQSPMPMANGGLVYSGQWSQ